MARLVLAALAYFASARLGYAFAAGGTVTLWPPSGVMLGLLVMAPRGCWPALVTGGLLGSLASDLVSHYPWPVAIAAALANGLETFVGALVMRRFLGPRVSFSTLRAVGVLILGVVVTSNAITGLAGASMMHFGFGIPFARSWFIWWAGDGLGLLIVAPVILTWIEAVRQRGRLRRAQVIEAAVLTIVLGIAAGLLLGPVPHWVLAPGPYLLFPLLLWAGVRFGTIGAATGTLLIAAVAIAYASLDVGPFVAANSGIATTVRAYAFLAVASLTSLTAAAALSERQRAIAQLRESRERYRNVVETATDAIITIGSDSRIRFANSATERIFGYPPAELVGSDLTTLMPPASRDAHKAGLARYVSTGQRGILWQGTSLVGLHKNGHEIPLEISFGELASHGRHEFTGILRDITEKRAAERTLEALEDKYRQSQKMDAIGQLAGGIAHDFNNLLTVVHVNCDLLSEQLGTKSPLRPEVDQIRSASQRAASLTRQLLAFSRRQILAPRVVSLADTLAHIEPMLRRLIGEHIAVQLRVPSPVGAVMADPGQLEQVVLNLAINARDAMPSGGALTIDLAEVVLDDGAAYAADVPPGRYARLSVSDDGVGMDADTAARVFEPFFTTKPMGRGTGLGLSTVHGIIKQSGGGIQVESQPGRGSTFHVYLPRVDAPLDAAHRAPEARDPGPRRETVLVVEDEEDVGQLTRRILQRQGYRVLLASSPREAMEIAAREPGLQVLLSDVVLPEMSGRTMAERLLVTHPRMRVLYMSGYTDDALSHHGVLARGTAFIAKPFTADALLRKLEEVINERA